MVLTMLLVVIDGDGGFHDVWRVRFALLCFCASLVFLRARSSQAA